MPGHRKVLLFAEYGDTGGTRTYVKQLLALYGSKRADVTLVASYPHFDPEMRGLCARFGFSHVLLSELTDQAFPIRGRLPFQLLGERKALGKFIVAHRPDVVVASVGTPPMFLGALGLAPRSLYIVHTYPEPSGMRWKRAANRLMFSALVPTRSRIVTVSHYAERKIAETWGLWARRSMLRVVYTATGPAVDCPRPTRSNSVSILTIGHVEDYKNPDLWIDVAAKVLVAVPGMNVTFRWIGPGALLSYCRDRVKALGLDRAVRFVGLDHEVQKYFAESDIYLQTSRVESLGLSVLDAMRYGLPSVVTHVGGLPELVADRETGWVAGVDADIIAEKTLSLVYNEGLRKEMGARAQARYVECFSQARWEKELWQCH